MNSTQLLGPWLRQFLARQGHSDVRIAQGLGVDRSSFSRWLSGKAPIPLAILPRLINDIGAHEHTEYIFHLHANDKQRADLNSLASHAVFRKLGCDAEHLAEHLALIARTHSRAEFRAGSALSEEFIHASHLWAAYQSLTSVKEAILSKDDFLFTPDNIRMHLKYPLNYYVGALLALNDEIMPGGSNLSRTILGLVNAIVADTHRNTFIEKLIWQHAIHLIARYGQLQANLLQPKSLLHSNDMHDRRIYILGNAFRSGSGDAPWSVVFDELKNEHFQSAVIAFDAAHYDNNVIRRDSWEYQLTAVENTVIRYLTDIESFDHNHRLFAAKRLKLLLTRSAPKMLQTQALTRKIDGIERRALSDMPKDGQEAVAVIKELTKGLKHGR